MTEEQPVAAPEPSGESRPRTDFQTVGQFIHRVVPRIKVATAAKPVRERGQKLVTEQSQCTICGDAGWLMTHGGPPGEPDFCKLIPCECKRAEIEALEQAKRTQLSGIGPLRYLRLDRYDPDTPGVRRAYLRAVEFANKPTGWLVLAGGYGCGKTHLAAGVANAAISRGESVIFQVVPDLLDAMRAAYSTDSNMSFDEQFNLIRDVPLLVLDDLGTEHATPWARDKLYRLINHRYNSRLPTVVTTNVWPNGIEPRIASRLADRDLGGVVEIEAEDYRQRKGRRS